MERSSAWRDRYRASRSIDETHKKAVSRADEHFRKRRLLARKDPLRTPPQAIQSKGDKRGRVLPRYSDWTEQEIRSGARQAGESEDTTTPDDTVGSSDVSDMVQQSTGSKRISYGRRNRWNRRERLTPGGRAAAARVATAMQGRRSAGSAIRTAAEAIRVPETEVIASVTTATETLSTATDPTQASAELAAAAASETDAEIAYDAALASEYLAYTAALAADPSSDVPYDITTDEILAGLQTVPLPAPMPTYAAPTDTTCPTCTDENMKALPFGGLFGASGNQPAFAPGGNVGHLMGRGIPNRFGSTTQRTAIPLATGTAIAAATTVQLALQPVSEIEPGAVLWVAFQGGAGAPAPTITALSVSGQNQLYGVAGAGLSQVFADVANFQSPGIFIPLRIPSNNSFQVSIQNNDAVNPITVDLVLVGTAVQLVQALAACGAS